MKVTYYLMQQKNKTNNERQSWGVTHSDLNWMKSNRLNQIEHGLNNEDDVNNEDNPQIGDMWQYKVHHLLTEKIVDDSSPWQAQYNWPQTGNDISCLNRK